MRIADGCELIASSNVNDIAHMRCTEGKYLVYYRRWKDNVVKQQSNMLLNDDILSIYIPIAVIVGWVMEYGLSLYVVLVVLFSFELNVT